MKGNKIKRILEVIDKINETTQFPLLFFLVCLTAIMNFEVLMRYVFNSPTMFSREFSLILQVGLGTIGAGYVLKHNGHVAVDFVYNMMGKRAQKQMNLFGSILGLFYCCILVGLSIGMLKASFLTAERTLDLAILIWPIKALFIIGICLFGLEFMLEIYKHWMGDDV
ncbi:MAG: TRAP transporter small permease subunit [Deltaproteobacteria bacterium]|nr:TRAP transporter small permease subunit [Deltaproteobacteria bacterium]